MQLNGIHDLIPFLNHLDRESIYYRLDHLRDDSIMVSFTLVGVRVELDFFSDHVEFSYFQGTEAVETDTGLLERLMREHWGDD
ncbi:hypothetical protein [Microvirga sp. BSC39]|uniref:hypothetical protein n=1 Tax=Microvirga sp. BSC39 TaxID=1549810 RepID=UPI0004E8E971|nr:hypothetical protein [Microvirga sp. BSC39]KFG68933.1 hypothetical protein JH26_12090 [Microvirga sp. BSC39]